MFTSYNIVVYRSPTGVSSLIETQASIVQSMSNNISRGLYIKLSYSLKMIYVRKIYYIIVNYIEIFITMTLRNTCTI